MICLSVRYSHVQLRHFRSKYQTLIYDFDLVPNIRKPSHKYYQKLQNFLNNLHRGIPYHCLHFHYILIRSVKFGAFVFCLPFWFICVHMKCVAY